MSDFWMHGDWLPLLIAASGLTAVALGITNGVARRRLIVLVGPRGLAHWCASALRDARLWIALALIALALSGPRFGERGVKVSTSGVDVVVLLDVSRSMDARDLAPSRLARSRRAARTLLAGLDRGDRSALAIYGGRGVLLTPLTPDHDALLELVDALDTSLIEPGGSRLCDGVARALEAFTDSVDRARLLVVLGDGENSGPAGDVGQLDASRAGVRVLAAAFGTDAGAEIRDHRGQTFVTRRRTQTYRELVDATGGRLLDTDAWGEIDGPLALAAIHRDITDAPGEHTIVMRRTPVVRPFAILALLVLCYDAIAGLRLRSRATHAPVLGDASGLRAGRLFGSLLIALLSLSMLGSDSREPESDVHEVPDALELLALGLERARSAEWTEALPSFRAAAISARDPELAGLAYHDLGVAALELGDLEAARDAFFDSLAVRPGRAETQFNLEWTLVRLANEPEPPESRPPERERDPEPAQERRPSDAPANHEDPSSRDIGQPDRQGPSMSESATEDTRRTAASKQGPGIHRGSRPEIPALDPDELQRWAGRVDDDVRASLRLVISTHSDAPPPNRREDEVDW